MAVPSLLMIGFTAEYESGEIKPDGVEIGHADWFAADEMPGIPPFGSISRLLIEDFKKINFKISHLKKITKRAE